MKASYNSIDSKLIRRKFLPIPQHAKLVIFKKLAFRGFLVKDHLYMNAHVHEGVVLFAYNCIYM